MKSLVSSAEECRDHHLEVAGSTPAPTQRTCAYCGRSFIPKYRNSTCCSRRCSIQASHLKHRLKRCEYMRKRRIRLRYGSDAVQMIQCKECGETFRQNRVGHVFCSATCRDKFNSIKHPHRRTKEQSRRSYQRLRKQILAYACFMRLGLNERLSSDPDYYANYRRIFREYGRKFRDKTRKRPYLPKLAMRIPDWAVKGEPIFDENSTFLQTSLEKNAYGRELAIDRGIRTGRIQE